MTSIVAFRFVLVCADSGDADADGDGEGLMLLRGMPYQADLVRHHQDGYDGGVRTLPQR